jgi:transcriptional regulator GlxA family with amidase domain
MRPKQIGLLGFDDVTASHLTVPSDAFSAAVLEDGFGGRIPCYKTWIVGLTTKAFRAESGLLLQPQATLETVPSLDTIIVPGGDALQRPELCEELAEWILSRAAVTRRIASICRGVAVLAPTGLLDGRDVTTHWHFARELAQRYPTVRVNHKRRLVRDGPFYTSAGLTGGVDLALALIEEDYGKGVALAVGRNLMTYLTTEDFSHEARLPSGFSQPIDRFADLVGWIMRHLHENLTVEMLARQACMCPAHFTRAFKSIFGTTPADFVENLRLNEAQRRLSSRGNTVRSVAQSVGFTNSDSFRRAFQRRFGKPPSSYLNQVPAASFTGRPVLR